MTSAFWHGFYPTYYLAFAMVGFLFATSRAFYKAWPLFTWLPKFFKTYGATQFGRLLFEFFFFAFVVLQPSNVYKIS